MEYKLKEILTLTLTLHLKFGFERAQGRIAQAQQFLPECPLCSLAYRLSMKRRMLIFVRMPIPIRVVIKDVPP